MDDADGSTAEAAQALGEASCATAPPDAEWPGQVPSPPPTSCQTVPVGIGNYTTTICTYPPVEWGNSPEHYSNPSCYKADVVKITNWEDRYGDLRIAAAGGLLAPVPSTQAECEALWMGATLYQNTTDHFAIQYPPKTRSAYGHWNPSLPIHCSPPFITFGGYTWRTDRSDVDTFIRGETYTIAASYRTSSSSSSQTLKMNWSSTAPRCGENGQSCCTGEGYPMCDNTKELLVCSSGICASCGANGQPACNDNQADPANPKLSCIGNLAVVSVGGVWKCAPCGDDTQNCCGQYNRDGSVPYPYCHSGEGCVSRANPARVICVPTP